MALEISQVLQILKGNYELFKGSEQASAQAFKKANKELFQVIQNGSFTGRLQDADMDNILFLMGFTPIQDNFSENDPRKIIANSFLMHFWSTEYFRNFLLSKINHAGDFADVMFPISLSFEEFWSQMEKDHPSKKERMAYATSVLDEALFNLPPESTWFAHFYVCSLRIEPNDKRVDVVYNNLGITNNSAGNNLNGNNFKKYFRNEGRLLTFRDIAFRNNKALLNKLADIDQSGWSKFKRLLEEYLPRVFNFLGFDKTLNPSKALSAEDIEREISPQDSPHVSNAENLQGEVNPENPSRINTSNVGEIKSAVSSEFIPPVGSPGVGNKTSGVSQLPKPVLTEAVPVSLPISSKGKEEEDEMPGSQQDQSASVMNSSLNDTAEVIKASDSNAQANSSLFKTFHHEDLHSSDSDEAPAAGTPVKGNDNGRSPKSFDEEAEPTRKDEDYEEDGEQEDRSLSPHSPI